MEKHSEEVTIYKDGEQIASSTAGRRVSVPAEWKDDTIPPVVFDCVYMPEIFLHRLIVIRILQGAPLSSIFNPCAARFGEEEIEPLYYVHGNVEVIQGNPYITSVVLARPNRELKPREIAPLLPTLFKRCMALI